MLALKLRLSIHPLLSVPSNLILKKVGANIWSKSFLYILRKRLIHSIILLVPTIVICFGFVCFITAFVTNFGEPYIQGSSHFTLLGFISSWLHGNSCFPWVGRRRIHAGTSVLPQHGELTLAAVVLQCTYMLSQVLSKA